jgi:transcriptional regulator with XRE-family HTH domain
MRSGVQWQRPRGSPSQPHGHRCVAFLPFLRLKLKCRRPKDYSENPQTLGGHIKKRRLELGFTQNEAAALLRVDPLTVLNWEKERTKSRTIDGNDLIAFLGYNPFPNPTTIGERLLQMRREQGWSIRQAAGHLRVDQCTWGDWERGELVLFREHRTKVAALLGLDLGEVSDEMGARWNGKHRRWETSDALALRWPNRPQPPADAGANHVSD